MSRYHKFVRCLAFCAALAMAGHAGAETEADRVYKLLLAPPDIKAEPGFTAKLLVPPNELYDPFYPFFHDGTLWIPDLGPNVGTTGSRIVSIDERGHVSVVVPATASNSMIAGGFAPADFGSLSGQLIMVAQQNSTGMGTAIANIIEKLDPANHFASSLVCILPKAGESGNGVPSFGDDARFGPPNSAFAGLFYAVTVGNAMIYKVDGAGKCSPFADFHDYGIPVSFRFTPDGSQMLVTTQSFQITPESPGGKLKPGGGSILRVSPEGKIDPHPLATGFDALAGIAIAPPGFGAFAGQIFVVDEGPTLQYPPPLTQRLQPIGKVYRITPDGQKHVVATGFIFPVGVEFVNNQLWITDNNAIYFGPVGGRELPDGFVAVITADK